KIKPVPVYSIKAVCTQEELSAKLAELYGEMAAEIDKNGLDFANYPMAIYHKYDPKAIEFEACIPLNKAGKSVGRIVAKELKGGPVAVIAHYGPYEKTYDAHMAMDKYLTANKKEISGSPWEVYITDPAKEQDPAKWLTEIYYPL
ncbi:MAG TPA: GyrI-like domain-containing protein, partial [Adhaeribacter sp.]|nr:GyrI-like domain-containing protein [Adhaeribacter sp.]